MQKTVQLAMVLLALCGSGEPLSAAGWMSQWWQNSRPWQKKAVGVGVAGVVVGTGLWCYWRYRMNQSVGKAARGKLEDPKTRRSRESGQPFGKAGNRAGSESGAGVSRESSGGEGGSSEADTKQLVASSSDLWDNMRWLDEPDFGTLRSHAIRRATTLFESLCSLQRREESGLDLVRDVIEGHECLVACAVEAVLRRGGAACSVKDCAGELDLSKIDRMWNAWWVGKEGAALTYDDLQDPATPQAMRYQVWYRLVTSYWLDVSLGKPPVKERPYFLIRGFGEKFTQQVIGKALGGEDVRELSESLFYDDIGFTWAQVSQGIKLIRTVSKPQWTRPYITSFIADLKKTLESSRERDREASSTIKPAR